METLSISWKNTLPWLVALIVLLAMALPGFSQVIVDMKIQDPSGNRLKWATVSVYDGNDLAKRYRVKKGKFNVLLDTGKLYMLEIDKTQFYSKRLSVNTLDCVYEPEPLDYKFIVRLDPLSDFEGIEGYEDLADFPASLIYYQDLYDEFTYSRKYHQSFLRDVYALREQAKELKRSMASGE